MSNQSKDQVNYTGLAVRLYRSLQRLSLAVEACGRIGFEESSPTRNAHHASIWLDLNEAQKDAKLKLKAYEDMTNAVLRQQIANDPDNEPSAGGGAPT